MKPTPLTLRKRLALELWRIHEANVRREHPLQQLFWECTLRCNLHCRHCGSDCRVSSSQRDMPREDFLRVLDGVARRVPPSQVFVVVSGGEPLMRDDLEQCGTEFKRRGFSWGMVTNGLLLTPQRFAALLRAGLSSLTVSLDGLEDEHNWMRGHPQSFRRVDQVLTMLTRVPGFVFDVVTCVNRRNYPKLADIKAYLVSKGVGHWRLFTVFPVGRAAADPDMQLTNDEFRGTFDFILATRREGRIMADYGCEGFLGNYEGEVRSRLFSCQAGVTVGAVLIDGSISACTSIRSDFHQGNIYTDDFMDVWEQRYHPYRHRQWMRQGDCAQCSYFSYCRGGGMHLRDGQGHLLFCHLKRLGSQGEG